MFVCGCILIWQYTTQFSKGFLNQLNTITSNGHGQYDSNQHKLDLVLNLITSVAWFRHAEVVGTMIVIIITISVITGVVCVLELSTEHNSYVLLTKYSEERKKNLEASSKNNWKKGLIGAASAVVLGVASNIIFALIHG